MLHQLLNFFTHLQHLEMKEYLEMEYTLCYKAKINQQKLSLHTKGGKNGKRQKAVAVYTVLFE